MGIYQAYNGPAPTTAAQVAVTTGTSIKTLLQISTPSTAPIWVMEWGISFDGAAAAAGVQCELLTTGTVGATITAHATSGMHPIDDPLGPASIMVTTGTTNTGYSASAEGTITTTRILDSQFVQPTGQYKFLWPLAEYPYIPVSTILRVRVKAAAAANALCYVRWRE